MSHLRAAHDSLDDFARLDAIGRQPRTAVWFPLLVFGLVNLGASPLVLIIGREHLGSYVLPANVVGGVLCALHYWRAGRVSGLQAPLFAWLGVIFAATIFAALCSWQGRELGWTALNLAGPGIAMVLGYSVLAAWARSLVLLVAVAAMAVAVLVAVTIASGDRAIAIHTGSFAAILLGLAAFNHSHPRSLA